MGSHPRAFEIWEKVADLAPVSLAEEWDNCGLQVGSPQTVVRRLLLALDPTPATLQAAVESGAEMVITHHPLIFSPLSSINTDGYVSGLVSRFLMASVVLYSAHTNLDSSEPGVSSVLASTLGIRNTSPLLPSKDLPHLGLGRIGTLDAPMTVGDMAALVSSRLGVDGLKICGDPHRSVTRVAVCGGSGSSLLGRVLANGGELYITGEIKHSTAIEAANQALALIDAGHYATERQAVEILKDYLTRCAEECGWALEILTGPGTGNPFSYWHGK